MNVNQIVETLYNQASKYAKYVFESEVAKNPDAAYKELEIAWKNFLLLAKDKPIQDLLKRDPKIKAHINTIQQSFTKFKADIAKTTITPDHNKEIAAQFTKLLKAEKKAAEELRKRSRMWVPIAIGAGVLGTLWFLMRKRQT